MNLPSVRRGLLLAGLAASATLSAQNLRQWPGVAPCDADFSTCLASAQAGDTVRIVSSQVIADRIALDRPLSIETAPGVSATFTATQAHTISIPGLAPWVVSLRRLRFVGGTVYLSIGGSQAGELLVEDLSFASQAANAQAQLQWQLAAGTSARSRVIVRRCEFEIGSDNNIAANGFRLHDGMAPTANFQRRGNLDFGYAMSNWPTAPGTLTIDPKLSPLGQPMIASPAIDAGSDAARAETGPGTLAALLAVDAQGLKRFEGTHIDIGAYAGERIHHDGAE